eukprot:TRINITY_DN5243_c0_g1_i10.p1 TRINITY_DN5243_c0_g1~~TRINITY_DN5243_c0_g1_i10.p1  ORF type:complete len:143 (-),score=9.00 TRINITY_DN5243_c0_g1_i10:14-442(-)
MIWLNELMQIIHDLYSFFQFKSLISLQISTPKLRLWSFLFQFKSTIWLKNSTPTNECELVFPQKNFSCPSFILFFEKTQCSFTHVLCVDTVSYTHLTLPTILLVQISVVAVSLKKKNKNQHDNSAWSKGNELPQSAHYIRTR